MKASVIIRAKNEETGIEACLKQLERQTFRDFEVVLVDSGSTDRTVDIARKYGARIIEIPPESFTFGYALNVGIKQAQGEIAVMISAHCLPYDEHYLDYLVSPFEQNQQLAGVYGRQVPFAGANPIEKRGLEEAYPEGHERTLVDRVMFSNAHSAIRRSVWHDHQFDEVLTGAEDIDWVKHIKAEGFVVGYEPRSVVYHSHQETIKQVYIRSYREARALDTIHSSYFVPHSRFGYIVRCVRAIVYDYGYLVTHGEGIGYGILWTIKIPFYRIGIYYGQYKRTQERTARK